MKRPYVVILNWNRWADTLRCLESVFSSSRVRPRIILCDNGSVDGSIEAFVNWANGAQPGFASSPRVWQLTHREEVEAGAAAAHRSDLMIIDNGENLGFAAGNNIGLRYALDQPDMDRVWLLNNDTIVDPDCLHQMMLRLDQAPNSICGSMIMSMAQPERISAAGGHQINRLTGIARPGIYHGQRLSDVDDDVAIENALDYLSGASMLIPRRFLEEVGLMDESYFLYYEEIDWAERADGWGLCLAARARIYHEEGASIGSGSLDRRPTARADLLMLRARLRFVRRHWPHRWALAYGAGWLQVGNRLRRGQFANALVMARHLLGGFRNHPRQWPAPPQAA